MYPYEFRYKISIIFRHPSIDPEVISSALQMRPEFKATAGQPRIGPRGDRLGEGVAKHSYWCSQEIYEQNVRLREMLRSVVEQLEAKERFLAEFSASHGQIEIDIAWFTGERNTGEVLDWDLLKRLGSLQIDLGFDIYGGRDPGDKTPPTQG